MAKPIDDAKDEGFKGDQSKLLAALTKISEGIKQSAKSSEAGLKYMEATRNISEMNFKSSTEESLQLQEALFAVGEKLALPNQTDQQIQNRLAELSVLQEKANAISERFANDSASNETSNSLQMLAQKLSLATETIEASIQNDELSDRIKALEGVFGYTADKTTKELSEAYALASNNLQEAIDANDQAAIELAKAQLNALDGAVQSEEKRREAAKAQELANDRLANISEGIKGLGKSFEDIADGALSGGGLFAGIAALVFAFIDPVKFAEVFGKVLNSLSDIFDGIIAIFSGDIDGGMALLGDNLGTIGALVGLLALKFGGAIIGAIGSVIAGAGTLFTSISTIASIMKAGLIAFGPAIAIAAAVGLVLFGIYKGLEHLRDSLGFTSIFDVIELGFAYLKDGLAMAANVLIDLVNGVTSFIKEKGGKLLDFLGIDFEIPDMNIERLSTNNVELKNAELLQKAEEERKQKELEESQASDAPEAPVIPESQTPKAPVIPVIQQPVLTSGAELDIFSVSNQAAKESQQSMAPVIAASASNNNSTNSVNNTTIVESVQSNAAKYLQPAFSR